MKYTKTITGSQYKTKVTISLDDDCKNGYETFSVTFDRREKHDNKWIEHSCGCSPEIISEYFPEFNDFLALHICDYKGIPLYPIENGYYHLHRDKKVAIEYLRLQDNEYDELLKCENKTQYLMKLGELKIVERWKHEADAAIQRLEKLTGEKFESKAVKDHFSYYVAKTQIDQIKE